jgi:hypothetical protein
VWAIRSKEQDRAILKATTEEGWGSLVGTRYRKVRSRGSAYIVLREKLLPFCQGVNKGLYGLLRENLSSVHVVRMEHLLFRIFLCC